MNAEKFLLAQAGKKANDSGAFRYHIR